MGASMAFNGFGLHCTRIAHVAAAVELGIADFIELVHKVDRVKVLTAAIFIKYPLAFVT